MFGFIKKVFFVAMNFFNFNVLGVNSLECVSMNNQECRTRPKITLMSLCYILSVLE